MSKDPSTKVGAIIVSPDKRKITSGYNGFPSAIPDRKEWWNNRGEIPDEFTKYELVNHAEENAIAQSQCSLSGWTLYCTHHPCLVCARHIVTAGINRVYYNSLSQTVMRLQEEKVKKLFDIAGVHFHAIDTI